MIDILLATVTFICLFINMVEDIRNRIAFDTVWIVQILSSLILIIVKFSMSFDSLLMIRVIVNIGIAVIAGFLTFYLGVWGGGDSKGIIATGFSMPWVYSFIPISGIFLFFPPIFFLIFNLIIGILPVILYFLLVNVRNYIAEGSLFSDTEASVFQKVGMMISCMKVPVGKIQPDSKMDPAEVFNNGIWVADSTLFLEAETDAELERMEREARLNCIENAKLSGREKVWMRPQVPGLVMFFAGFVYYLFAGSPLVYLLQLLS